MPRNKNSAFKPSSFIWWEKMAITDAVKEKRRALVGEFWITGISGREIAEELRKREEYKTLDIKTVYSDINIIKTRLVAENIGKLEKERARSVAVLRRVQSEAWATIQINHTSIPLPLKGRDSYLRVIADCEEKIARILGTFAPVRLEHTGEAGGPMKTEIVVVSEKAKDLTKDILSGKGTDVDH